LYDRFRGQAKFYRHRDFSLVPREHSDIRNARKVRAVALKGRSLDWRQFDASFAKAEQTASGKC
jgi:hypothetical protein